MEDSTVKKGDKTEEEDTQKAVGAGQEQNPPQEGQDGDKDKQADEKASEEGKGDKAQQMRPVRVFRRTLLSVSKQAKAKRREAAANII